MSQVASFILVLTWGIGILAFFGRDEMTHEGSGSTMLGRWMHEADDL